MTLFVNNAFKSFAVNKNYNRSRHSPLHFKNTPKNMKAFSKKNTNDNMSASSMESMILATPGAIEPINILGSKYNIFVPKGSDIYKEIKQNNPILYSIAMMDENWDINSIPEVSKNEYEEFDYGGFDYEEAMNELEYEYMWSEYDRISEMYD